MNWIKFKLHVCNQLTNLTLDSNKLDEICCVLIKFTLLSFDSNKSKNTLNVRFRITCNKFKGFHMNRLKFNQISIEVNENSLITYFYLRKYTVNILHSVGKSMVFSNQTHIGKAKIFDATIHSNNFIFKMSKMWIQV